MMGNWIVILWMLPPAVLTAQPMTAGTQPAYDGQLGGPGAASATQPGGLDPAAAVGFASSVVFARSGNKAFVEVGPKGPVQVVLRAFGRTWTAPSPRKVLPLRGFGMDLDVPAVRVPTVFAVCSPDHAWSIGVGLVAYPDRDVAWDKQIVLCASDPPSWFTQWAGATGLPVKRVAAADLTSAKLAPADEKKTALLILGWTATGERTLAEVQRLANDKGVNILLLASGPIEQGGGPVSIAPKQMREGLADIAKQSWPVPLKFFCRRETWPGIANRWAWIIDDKGLPLVEEVLLLSDEQLRLLPAGEPIVYDKEPAAQQAEPARRVILNHVAWDEQLGRNESADASFLTLLSAAAKAPPRTCLWHPVWLAHPARADVKEKDRPILAAIRSGGFWPRADAPHGKPEYNGPIYNVLDLRGPTTNLPDGIKDKPQWSLDPKHSAPVVRLLILGDDPMLDEWKWLKLDRAKKTINRADVLWLSDDELPPSKASQIRLMLTLTELGVPLAPPSTPDSQHKGK